MSSPLETYRAKRDPRRTPEPMGGRRRRNPRAPSFVIQEHRARSLHFDFRLERDGVLVSWALPKGLPSDPTSNRLAVHTEDHPLEYATFEGDIPAGAYGAGHVTVWDRGTYDAEKWNDDEIKVVLHGQRATGRYVLFPVGAREQGHWMMHRMDSRTGHSSPPPERLKPMLAEAGGLPRDRSGWSYEFKWDGLRAIVTVEAGHVRAHSRNGNDLTSAFPELEPLASHLTGRTVMIDGEIVAFDEKERPSFSRLQQRLHLGTKELVERRARAFPVTFLVFDLLWLDDRSTMDLPYDERRRLLESLDLNGETYATPPAFPEADGEALLALSAERGFEGVIVKRRDAPYAPGQRNGEWRKVKNFRTQEVVVGGWSEGKGARRDRFGALLLGIPDEHGLAYVGKVGTGFSESALAELVGLLSPLSARRSPFSAPLPRQDVLGAHFVRPAIVGEVRFSEWTGDGRLRHPSWRGLRPDKDADEVRRES